MCLPPLQSDLVPVPSQLFQGKVASTVLGTETVRGSTQVLVHPLLIGGWCGLVSTALNCLPVGRVDGGRMVQVGFGCALSGINLCDIPSKRDGQWQGVARCKQMGLW